MDIEQITRHVEQILGPSGVGSSPDEIAETLEHEGVYGWPEDGTACPVWHLLDRELGHECVSFFVDHNLVELRGVGYRRKTIETPDPVADFIEAFDNGKYPELRADEQ